MSEIRKGNQKWSLEKLEEQEQEIKAFLLKLRIGMKDGCKNTIIFQK